MLGEITVSERVVGARLSLAQSHSELATVFGGVGHDRRFGAGRICFVVTATESPVVHAVRMLLRAGHDSLGKFGKETFRSGFRITLRVT